MDKQDISKKDELLLKIRGAGDLPGMAETMNLIQRLRSSEDSAVTDITNLILRDYALTTKLLKVVNSVLYLQFGQVTTISRAIFLLGLERIKEIALSLIIFEQLQTHNAHPLIMDVISQAFFGGFFAEKIVRNLNFVEEEEAFICALLHPLGKILVAFSFPEKVLEIQKLSQEEDLSENSASAKVLGISFEEIGVTMATEWNFPPKIVQSMHSLSPKEVSSSPGEVERLGLVANLATEVTNELATDLEKKDRKVKIDKILTPYKEHFAVPDEWEELISSSAQDMNQLASELDRNIQSSSFNKQLAEWSLAEEGTKSEKEIFEYKTENLKTIETLFPMEAEENPETVFSQGIQDINQSVLQPFALNDIIRIALETMHRGMKRAGIFKTLFLVKHTQNPVMQIRFGFGEAIEETKKWFIIPLGEPGDIFNVALVKSTDLIIKDTHSLDIKKVIPFWYRKNNPLTHYLILLPITINKKIIGLICLEGEPSGLTSISKDHFNYLRILRDQIVMAISRLASKG